MRMSRLLDGNGSPSADRRTDARTVSLLLAIVLFWGSAFAAIRAGLDSYAPGELALLRFAIASTLLALYAAATRMPLPAIRDLPAILALGLLGISLYQVPLAYGELTVSAGSASLLVGAGPVMTALLARAFKRHELRPWGWLGIAVSLVGVALVGLAEGEGLHFAPGALLVLVAAISFSAYCVFQEPYLKKYGALRLTTYAIWAGTLLMVVFLPGLTQSVGRASLAATLSVAYLGVFPGALAYVAWSHALSRAPAPIVASFLYLVPVSAIVVAWVWLGEAPSGLSLLGGCLSMAGVVLVNARGR
jgi:drug/metabolite transporter (DMT)-like permease